jgi:hypothetical protein
VPVTPAWRGTFIVPVAARWAFKRYSVDPTSGSLRKTNRRGTPVVPAWRGVPVTPAEAEWTIQHEATDLTSRSSEKRTLSIFDAKARIPIGPGLSRQGQEELAPNNAHTPSRVDFWERPVSHFRQPKRTRIHLQVRPSHEMRLRPLHLPIVRDSKLWFVTVARNRPHLCDGTLA